MVSPTRTVSLGKHTTLRVGGDAAAHLEVTSVDDIKAGIEYAATAALPWTVLGGGSNLLVPDEGYSGVVLHMKIAGVTFTDVSPTQVRLTAAAGEDFDAVVNQVVEAGLWGLENLSAIPGSVGATPIQNVGAYGVEVGDLIESVLVYDTSINDVRLIARDACRFGYRDSFFKTPVGRQCIVLAVNFVLSRTANPKLGYKDLAERFGDTATPRLAEIRQAVIDIRSKKFPDWHVVGTAGSFFKNPILSKEDIESLRLIDATIPVYEHGEAYKVSLGYILDKVCGLRGYTRGHVRLYEAQALVLVADIGATAREVIQFAEHIAEIVFAKTKIKIEWEVNILK